MFSTITVGLLVVLALVSLRSITISHASAVQIARADLDALSDATAIQGLFYQRGFASMYFLTGDESRLNELDRASANFEQWLADVTRGAAEPATQRKAEELAAAYRLYDEQRDRAIVLYRTGRRDEAIGELRSNSQGRARALAAELLLIRRHAVEARLDEAEHAWHQALFLVGLAIAIGLASAALAGFLLARRVARPLYELVLRAESAAGGARVEVNTTDEIAALSEHVTRLAARIEESSAALAEQRARLSQAEKMTALGEMATAVAHEVLNPLTGVKAAMQQLAREEPSPHLAETVVAVDAEIGRVETMARRLVRFARPVRPSVRTVELEELVPRVLQAARAESEARQARIDVLLGASRSVAADPDLLLQVLINLTVNACQAIDAEGRVTISARSDGAWSVIEVRDDGRGIAPEVADRLFQPFTTTRRDGHGLGLALSQNIALAHGGRLEVRPNAPARGVTFALWLPVGSRAAEAAGT